MGLSFLCGCPKKTRPGRGQEEWNCNKCTRSLLKRYEVHICLTGLGGSTSDSRVLRDAISRPNGLRVP